MFSKGKLKPSLFTVRRRSSQGALATPSEVTDEVVERGSGVVDRVRRGEQKIIADDRDTSNAEYDVIAFTLGLDVLAGRSLDSIGLALEFREVMSGAGDLELPGSRVAVLHEP